MRIKKLMQKNVTTVQVGAPLVKIVRAMVKYDTDSVVLTDKWGAPRGIVTEHDVFQSLDHHRLQSSMYWYEKEVYRPPPRPLISLSPGHTVGCAVDIMDRMSIRHILVVAEGELVGILSAREVLSYCAGMYRSGACPDQAKAKATRARSRNVPMRAMRTPQ